ncbi:MAG: hypothetical protein VXY05_05290 [Pseudomonadota bacterium]|nr:hypothetical protein [Pseudomonadota bacterium]
MKNPVLSFALCALFGFMVLRFFVGSTEGPLKITPSGGLGKNQAEFLHDRITELALGKRVSGLVAELTNFDWDTVCLFLPGWLPPGGANAPYPLYNPMFTGDPKFFHIVFGNNGVLNMTIRVKRTDQLDYDLAGKSKTGCLNSKTSFLVSSKSDTEYRSISFK